MKVKLFTCEHCQGRGMSNILHNTGKEKNDNADFKCEHCNGYGEVIAVPEDIVVIRA